MLYNVKSIYNVKFSDDRADVTSHVGILLSKHSSGGLVQLDSVNEQNGRVEADTDMCNLLQQTEVERTQR